MENLLLNEFTAEKGKMKFKAEILTTKQKIPQKMLCIYSMLLS